jgi:hypothetical protein
VKRWTRTFVGIAIALSFQAAAHARADRIYTNINVGDPYRGDVEFRTAPDLMPIPGTSVYTIRGDNGYDLYRYDGTYYLVDNGTWYRASSWRGPFTYIRMNSVPSAVVSVPMRFRRAWSSVTAREVVPSEGTGRYVETETRVYHPGRRYTGSYLSFRRAPRMDVIPGTSVYYIRNDDFDHDFYRYGSRWYYVEDGVWYVSDTWRGPFFTIRWRDVPASVRHVPGTYRRTWTWAGATDMDRDRYTRGGVTVRVGERYRGTDLDLTSPPHMSIIPDTDVYFMRNEADYDLYRYGDTWYLVDNGLWYRAASWRGPFYRIRMSSVPTAVTDIPSGYRKTWVPTSD